MRSRPHGRSETQRRALTLEAEYIQETRSERDPHEFTPEESRRARAVPVYAALRVLGRAGVQELVERCCALARRMAATLGEQPDIRVLNDVVLNQVLVRAAAADESAADTRTRQAIEAVQREGTCWLGGTTWQGKAAMRISISNWSTTENDIDRSARVIADAFRNEEGGPLRPAAIRRT